MFSHANPTERPYELIRPGELYFFSNEEIEAHNLSDASSLVASTLVGVEMAGDQRASSQNYDYKNSILAGANVSANANSSEDDEDGDDKSQLSI